MYMQQYSTSGPALVNGVYISLSWYDIPELVLPISIYLA